MTVRWLRPPVVERTLLGLLAIGLVGYWILRSDNRASGPTRQRWVSKGSVLGQLHTRSGIAVQPFLEPLNPSGRQWDLTNCRRCSIVGNTGLLLHSSLGHRIDATNCVFRFGFAPTDAAYRRDVGERTTLRLVDSTSLKNSDFTELQALSDAHHVVIFDTERSSLATTKSDVKSLFSPQTQVWRLSSYGVTRSHTLLQQEIRRLRLRSRGFIPSHYWNLHSESMCEALVGTELPSRYEAQILKALSEPYNLTYEEPSWN